MGVGAGLDDIFGEEDDGECWHELHDEDGLGERITSLGRFVLIVENAESVREWRVKR